MRQSVLLFALVLIMGCAQQNIAPVDDEQAGSEIKVTADNVGELKEFTITAKQFEFEPSTLTVGKGDIVKLIITSADVTHGFVIDEFGISETIEPGKMINVEFVADKAGTFTYYCNIPCGAGHSNMRGTLEVE